MMADINVGIVDRSAGETLHREDGLADSLPLVLLTHVFPELGKVVTPERTDVAAIDW